MSNRRTLITGYISPDLDAYACSHAYAELHNAQGRDAQAGSYGQPLAEVDFAINYAGLQPMSSPNPRDFEAIIVVDNSRISNMDPRTDPSKVIEVIDHRDGTDPTIFPNAKWQVELVGAAATLIAEKFQTASIEPTRSTAILLLAGILSNTLNFKFYQTSERDHQMAEYLSSIAKTPADFAHQLFTAKSDLSGQKLGRQLRDDFAVTDEVNGRTIGMGQIEVVDGSNIINSRIDEILEISNQLKDERHAEFIVTALADVESGKTYFISNHQPSQGLVSRALGISFHNSIAKCDQVVLRKQYFHTLKALL